MLALCLMLSLAYYANNYASIIDSGLMMAQDHWYDWVTMHKYIHNSCVHAALELHIDGRCGAKLVLEIDRWSI